MRSETFEKRPYFVIPAKVGIQKVLKGLDSFFRRNDNLQGLRRNSKFSKPISTGDEDIPLMVLASLVVE